MASLYNLNLHFPACQGLPWWLRQSRIHPKCRRLGFNPWVGKIPGRRAWQPTAVFLPEESHGQRSLVGCSPWGRKEPDTTEWLHFHFPFSFTDYPWRWTALHTPDDNFFFSSLGCSFKSSAKFSTGLIDIIISVFKVNVFCILLLSMMFDVDF